MNESALTHIKTVDHWRAVVSLLGSLKPLRDLENECGGISQIRETVKRDLRAIHENVREFLSENNAYYVVFALASHCDEVARAHVESFPGEAWLPLQSELFGTDDAGNLFYKYIELFRGRNDISQITFQTFYFCLNDGFKGRYIFEPETQTGFKHELLSYIHISPIPKAELSDFSKRRRALWKLPVWAYYVSVPVGLYLIRLLLSLIPINTFNL